MAYDYYRSSVPGWGTSQFQFSAPPAPAFRPQPTWGGLDYYSAHALNPDPTFYNSVLSGIGQAGGVGLGRREARYWHRRVYSGLSPLAQLLPTDIGAAAAYEAYRTWKHNPTLYEPLGMDPVRVREGLIGMAIAETTRLWQYGGRPMDTYGLRAASEAAASVATILAERLLSYTANDADAVPPELEAGYRARARSNSFNVPSVMRAGGSPYLGGGTGAIPAGPPTMNAMGGGAPLPPSPIPGVAAASGGMGVPPPVPPTPMPPGIAGVGGTMLGSIASPTPMAAGAGMPPGPMPVRVPAGGLGSGAGVPPPGTPMASAATGAMGAAVPSAGAYGSAMAGAGMTGAMGAYGGAAGGGMPMGAGSMGGGPPPTVIIERSARRPRARRYSDSYTERPRSRSTIEVIPPAGGAPGNGVGGTGGMYGGGGMGMYGGGAWGGAGARAGMYGAAAGAGNAYAAAMGGGGYGAGMGGGYGASGAYGGAGYGGMPGAAGEFYGGAGMTGAPGYASSGTGPGGAPGPTLAAKEEAVEEEAEEGAAAGGRFGGAIGGLARNFRAGMGAGLNATGFGRGAGY
ncbi:hypothetical protein PYCCODRAFT_194549 [Trametes coccinea BRFM310]|uniref:Uncharacterized protein n=1 Tax=Trametes coccinea (strain BRFM310) TaxID=1353009 RepID=A0A1Y2ISV6_TRAC3|nr:hypothetical protein PYCCODRAFT_194549 [Trametes coccinea BRFM310]